MDYPLRFADQLRAHLQALRKKRGLTQAQAGALVGVSQARIAEIEANPGVVGLEQLMKLLAALGASISLRDDSDAAPVPVRSPADERASPPAMALAVREKDVESPPSVPPSPEPLAPRPAASGRFVAGPRKGNW